MTLVVDGHGPRHGVGTFSDLEVSDVPVDARSVHGCMMPVIDHLLAIVAGIPVIDHLVAFVAGIPIEPRVSRQVSVLALVVLVGMHAA
ncbi:hypothetical protein [Tsukamurella tyrosinosolvens]|uniref:hypothetical protein n=1 Tax=Tsukamurella tyrosinosolvens TaxID=57704 RepID=UPI0011149715|nr:hypothetical protein [Tsukamurella tyrosinosolvens]